MKLTTDELYTLKMILKNKIDDVNNLIKIIDNDEDRIELVQHLENIKAIASKICL